MSCGCNGHTSSPGAELDPSDWTINPFGNPSSDVVYYTKPKVTSGNIIDDYDYDKIRLNVDKERARHNNNTKVEDPFIQGEIIDAGDFNVLINGLNQVWDSGQNPVSIGTMITASEINKLVDNIYTSGTICVCNCNYCSCNCNACTCNCNYACTCQCNYTYSDKTLKINIEAL